MQPDTVRCQLLGSISGHVRTQTTAVQTVTKTPVKIRVRTNLGLNGDGSFGTEYGRGKQASWRRSWLSLGLHRPSHDVVALAMTCHLRVHSACALLVIIHFQHMPPIVRPPSHPSSKPG